MLKGGRPAVTMKNNDTSTHTCISANTMPDTALRTLQSLLGEHLCEYLFSGGYCVIFFSIYLRRVMFSRHLPISLCTLLLFWLSWVFIVTCGLSPLVAANGLYLLVAGAWTPHQVVSLVAENGL